MRHYIPKPLEQQLWNGSIVQKDFYKVFYQFQGYYVMKIAVLQWLNSIKLYDL